MGVYNRIIVAVDGSDASLNALSESIKLSYWVRGSVCAVYVAPSYEGDLSLTGVKSLEELLTGPCKDVLAKIKETVKKTDASIQALCLEGEPFEKIIEYAETGGFDLIVTGVEKKNAFYRRLIGGVTEKIIRFGLKDILIIPENTTIGLDKILIVDAGVDEDNFGLKKAIEIGKSYGSELLFLPNSEDKIKRKLLKTGFKAIINTAHKNDINLIIISYAIRKGIRNYISGNNAEKVVYTSSCPVLVICDNLVK